ncbi:hypothetical protein RvY_10699-2 [Ramazzottius varieornatus]|nr:hypothetical protein RvY_10699-2 [Ramazzottius varieornatus]
MLTRLPMATFVPVMNFTSVSAEPTSAKTISHISFPSTIVVQKASSQTQSTAVTDNSTQTITQLSPINHPSLSQSNGSGQIDLATSSPTTTSTTAVESSPTTSQSTTVPQRSSHPLQTRVHTVLTPITTKAGWILPEASFNMPPSARTTVPAAETTTTVNPDVAQAAETPETEYFAPSVTAKPTIPRPLPTSPRTRKPSPATLTTTPRSQPLLTFPIGLQNRCNNVPVLFNGRYTVDMLGPMMVARYTCNTNFNLVGIPFLTCTPDGSWRGIMPLCIPGYGPTLIPPLSTRSKTEATRFSPTSTAMTNFNTLVTSLTPQQARLTPLVRAGPFRTPATNHTASVTGRVPHVTGQPYTEATHTASQSQTDHTTSNTSRPETGTRPPFAPPSVDPPRLPVTQPPPACPPLPVVEYAEMLYQRDTIFFRCLPGYVLVGNNSTVCLPEGVWDSLPDCFPVDCGQPEKLPSGMVILVNGSTTYGSIAAYSCTGQLVTLGIFYRVCGARGRWEGPVADCVAEIPTLVPAESRQEVRGGISGMMTIIVGVVGTIGGVVIVVAIAVSIKCLRSRESIPVAVSPTPYSHPSDYSPRALMTERASADIFSRARYVPSTASSPSGYEFDGSISGASTRPSRLEPRRSL